VASGAGIALLPESAAENHVVIGVRFVPVDHAGPAFESTVLTLPGTSDELATARLLRAVARASQTAPTLVSPGRLAA
jgi:DNA-binding transcriptional LysR family regulator